MGVRILSKEEREALSPEAMSLVCRHMEHQISPPSVIEKVLLQAVIVSRMNQCQLNDEIVSFLIEKISEYEGIAVLDPETYDREGMQKYS
jgi:hypothetical protein